MKQWEQIAFAIALAAFGWLLFNANKKAGASSSASPVADTVNNSIVPWYLTYNQAAGFTGPLMATQLISGGQPLPSFGNQGGGCDTCNSSLIASLS